jgi:hypothetical protein
MKSSKGRGFGKWLFVVRRRDVEAPVDGLVLRVKQVEGGSEFASNAIAVHCKRSKVLAVAALEPKEIFLVVHRIDFSVYFRRIEREAHTILAALRAGKSVASAIEMGFKKSSIPEIERGGYVRHSFEAWAALGWFWQSKPTQKGKD